MKRQKVLLKYTREGGNRGIVMYEKILSISIASYNVEEYLNDTVSSLIIDDEWLKKLEIIIVNDGSKDGTIKIARELEHKYPKSIIVIDKSNGGYGSTINSALAVAKGKYYKLLDGDDWYDTNVLKEFIAYLEKCESDLVVSPYYEVRDRDELIDNHQELPVEGRIINDIEIEDKPFAMHEIAVKTSVLRRLEKDITEHCFYTDAEFVFYCLIASESIARFDKGVYRYRLGLEGQSVSIEGIRKHYEDMHKVAERMFQSYHDCAKQFTGTKKRELEFCVRNITYHTYRAYFLINDPIKKVELISFDNEIKENYPDIYKLSNESKLVHTIRLLHFEPYRLLSRILINKYIRE